MMIPRIAFQSVAVCLVGLAVSLTPQIAQARGHGGGFHGGGFHGGGFHGGGFRGGFYGGGFGRSFYGGGIYAGRGYYGGYRGFYPRYYGGFYPRFYGGYYPRFYGGYVGNFGYYGAGYGGYGNGYGGYSSNYGNCTCGTYNVVNSGYATASLGGAPAGTLNSRVISANGVNSNSTLAYYLKNNPYNTPRLQDQAIVSNRNLAPASHLPADKLNPTFFPARTTEQAVVLPPAPML